MGLRNIIPIISRNRIYESYIVGNLYIDSFEAPDFPDMAGTNRQGYNESDPRWNAAVEHIREIVDEVVKLHEKFAWVQKQEKEKSKLLEKEKNELKLQEKLTEATSAISDNLTKEIESDSSLENMEEVIQRELATMKSVLGFKSIVDATKKKIIISHTLKDKKILDVVYKMLVFNKVPKEDIIYSNGPDPETNLPERDIYGYLRKFFVNSASSEKIYVLFVTSENVLCTREECPEASWGVLMEIGATWITKKDHWIFNVGSFNPLAPLNIKDKWVLIHIQGEEGDKIITMLEAEVNSFAQKIIETCNDCGYSPKNLNDNKEYLKSFVEIIDYID